MGIWLFIHTKINTLRPRQNGHHLPNNIFKCIFLNENVWISIKISLKVIPKGPIDNIPALVQIMAWHRSGDKPSVEPMMVSLLRHICVTRPHWVKNPNIFVQEIHGKQEPNDICIMSVGEPSNLYGSCLWASITIIGHLPGPLCLLAICP